MRVTVIGAHGTGKTTLAKSIAEKLGINFIPDVVSQAYKLGFPINEDTPPETQFWILSKQLELERNTPEPWIIEKSIWDNIVYGSFSIKDKEVLNVITKIVDANTKYDIVFYLPIEFPIPHDGLRSMNKKFQKDIDNGLKKVITGRKVKYIKLNGNEKTRLDKALKIIRGFMSRRVDG